jgi:hypothetical protein
VNMQEAQVVLLNGGRIKREGSRSQDAEFYLESHGTKQYLFERTSSRTSPAAFDWDDITAPNWKAVETTSTRQQTTV